MFEIQDKDGLARITKLTINKHKITCPTIMPVINPNKMIVPMEELGDFDIIITNSYIIKNSFVGKEIEEKDYISISIGKRSFLLILGHFKCILLVVLILQIKKH